MKHNSRLKLVIANRGEIARRIIRAAREKNFSVAVISTEQDTGALCRDEADEVLMVSTFLNVNEIVQASLNWGATHIHPGYGFLSENAHFARACEDSGIIFVGPTSENMNAMGSKESAKKIAMSCGVPTLSALFSNEIEHLSKEELLKELKNRDIKSPFLVKASGGGGGRGMRIVHHTNELFETLKRASDEALAAFGNPTVFVEHYLQKPRHIEIQVFGDGNGGGVFFGERECSLQRRHQKVIEQAPSPAVSTQLREKMGRASLELVRATKYRGAGTLEFLLGPNEHFYFLEMNTRLQVEHPVTEHCYEIDLVHAQLDLACGNWPENFPNPNLFFAPTPKKFCVEARILAEDTQNNFLPTPGLIELYVEPCGQGVRVDSGVKQNSYIHPFFDSMISKLIVHGSNQSQVVAQMNKALESYLIGGITTNIPFLKNTINHPNFKTGEIDTFFIEQNIAQLNKSIIDESDLAFLTSQKVKELLFKSFYEASYPKIQNKLEHIFCDQKFSSNQNSKITINAQKYLNHCVKFEIYGPHELDFFGFMNNKKELEIFIQGQRVILSNPGLKEFAQSESLNHQKEIRAPMAGKVYDVCVTQGSHVDPGTLLFVIESMKMQLEVRSQKAGVLKNVCVKKGQILSGPDVLGVLEPTPA